MGKRKKIKNVKKLSENIGANSLKITQAALQKLKERDPVKPGMDSEIILKSKAIKIMSRRNKAGIPDSLGKNAMKTTEAGKQTLAMDSDLAGTVYSFVGSSLDNFGLYGFSEFMGYAALSNLMQAGLLRLGPEVIADEMTRKWIKLAYSGEEESQTEKLKEIEGELERLDAQEIFNKAEFNSQFFGGCLVYIGLESNEGFNIEDDREELKTPIKPDQIKRGIKYLKIVEPINIYPGRYQSTDALQENYFKPETWFILGKEVHESRLLYFAANEAPILLKPAYNFFGIPPVQFVFDYVNNFFSSRDSAARVLKKFSLTYLKTNMKSLLSGGGAGDAANFASRMELLAMYRDNDSVAAIDKDSEDFGQINTPLSGIVDIVRQTLEFVAMLYKIPTVKFLGISPGGFNSTGESDFQNFYDHILSSQEKRHKTPLKKLIDYIQIAKFGEIDPLVSFKFVPLKEMTAKEIAEINKMKAETDDLNFNNGFVSQEDCRKRVASDPDSGYEGLDVDDLPEIPEEVEETEREEEVEETGIKDPNSMDPSETLNGAQVTALVDVIMKVSNNEIDKDTAVKIIDAAFPMNTSKAKNMLKDIIPKTPEEEIR